ncbi:hypothetical protein DPMN_166301 [Dreissena polymorpha]|uniref:Uncharacterized protein n=1 Tax=Dreissena polymorpha TaxID=45954 RepID=A0A9D4EWL7_DREPO|nr:hypothetical protein DPMN_166301 [Dreissena polymorpha]
MDRRTCRALHGIQGGAYCYPVSVTIHETSTCSTSSPSADESTIPEQTRPNGTHTNSIT